MESAGVAGPTQRVADHNNLRICYLILLHHKFEQARRLLHRLAGSNCGFVLHIDNAADRRAAMALRSEVQDLGLVAYASSVRSRWGSYQGALASVRCIETALELGPFDRYVLLSGQDYPIASRGQIVEFFDRNRSIEYVEAIPQDVTDEAAAGWSAYFRFRRYHLWMGNRRIVLPMIRKGAPPVPIFHGSQWWALTHAAVAHVAREFDCNRALRRYFKSSFLVDEAYIPTLLMNSSFAEYLSGSNVTFAEWTPTSGPHPKTLTVHDLAALLASGKLFARKLDDAVDGSLMDLLDEAHAVTRPSAPDRAQ